MMDVQVQFESPERWEKKYQRNNKRNGLKNLRCFPFCGVPHKEKGFCGSAVRVKVNRVSKEIRHQPLHSWSEFARTDEQPSISIGSILSKEQILLKERDRNNPTRPWYRGEVFDTASKDEASDKEDEDEEEKGTSWNTKQPIAEEKRKKDVVCFEFNKRKRGWNYSWAANKHTCNVLHALFVYLMVPHDGDSFKCIGIFSSPHFQVFCRKRPPRGTVDTHAGASPTSSLSSGAQSPRQQQQQQQQQHSHTGFASQDFFHSASQQQHQLQHTYNYSGSETPYLYSADSGYDSYRQVEHMPPAQETMTFMYNHRQEGQRVEYPPQQQLQQQRGDMYARYYNSNPSEVVSDPRVAPMMDEDEESLFREYFLDNFWNDEGTNVTDFDVQSTRLKRARQASVIKHDSFSSLPPTHAQAGNEMPKPPPLKEIMKREEAHRQDPAPPSEVKHMFGRAVDNEEEMINNKVWRMVLVLALVEAHWCEVNHMKRRISQFQSTDSAAGGADSWDLFEGLGDPFGDMAFEIPVTSVGGGSSRMIDDQLVFPQPLDEPSPVSNGERNRRPSMKSLSSATVLGGGQEQFLPKMDKDSRALVQSLANFLIEEKTFTRAIADALSALPESTSMKKRKAVFIKVAHEQLGQFCETQDISLAQFDRLFEDQPPIEFLKQAATRLQGFQETMRTYTDMRKERTNSNCDAGRKVKRERTEMIDGPFVDFNCSGVYEMDQNLLDAHAFMREVRGVPWVLRKMISYIEQRFEIVQEGFERIIMQGNRKLLSNGVNVYITDGVKHQFTLQSPVPWSRPLAVDYKAWFTNDPPALHVIHYYSETERLERTITWGRYCLHFRLFFQVRADASDKWTVAHERDGYANLVTRGDGFNPGPLDTM